MDSFGIKFENDIGEQLRAFADAVRQKAMRPAAYAAAAIIYAEMRILAPVYEGPIPVSKKTGLPRVHPGQLRDAIYHWHDDKQSDDGRQVYAIGPNKRKAPHWHLLEYGTVKMAAQPYITPAYTGKIHEAMNAARAELAAQLENLT